MNSQSTRFDLPGYTLPLDYTPDEKYKRKLFPNALDARDIYDGWANRIYVHREILMMQAMNSLTDKPDWERKVFNNNIVKKWREELTASGQDFTPKIVDWIIDEVRWKAGHQEASHLVVYDSGVVKSDSAISSELKEALREAVHPLEDIPEEKKDYHPESDKRVVDLVHPSLFPVIYDRSRILPDRVIGIDNCLESVGQGKQLVKPSKSKPSNDPVLDYYYYRHHNTWDPFSHKFQWMPCDVEFTEDSRCRVVSYINNLHPENRSLYEIIEKILARTIPLWDTTLTHVDQLFRSRIPYDRVDFLEHPDPEPQEPANATDNEMREYYNRYSEWEESRPIKRPEPDTFTPPSPNPRDAMDLRTQFAEHGLQVIVKLANIELTPERPEYNGGSWHVEGQSNEHICATALYYYSSENITENHLSFRQRAAEPDDIDFPQGQPGFLQEVFGFPPEVYYGDTDVTQALGSVSTREGRLLTFPNILQHRVSPFSLADKSRPGHRKILAFFLVDPHIRIISSANIPPQQEEWWSKRREVINEVLGSRLPVELQEMVNDNDDVGPITMNEAKQYRLELMEERSLAMVGQNAHFETGSFNLCEH